MDLKHVKAFLHVVELGSLSRAAERLNLTQPALSRQIRLLEEDLGTPLLVRTGRGTVPTEDGLVLEARARPLVAELEALAGDVTQRRQEVSGEIGLGIPPTLANRATAEMLRDYRLRYPKVSVRLTVALSGAVHDALLRGRLDLGLLVHPQPSANLHSEVLWNESLHVVAPPAAGLRPEIPVSLAEVVAHPMVLPGPRHGLRVIVEGAAARAGLALQVAMEVESLRMNIELISLGVGWSLLPLRAVGGRVAGGTLSVAPLDDPPLRRNVDLAWAADRRLGRAAGALADIIRSGISRWDIESRV